MVPFACSMIMGDIGSSDWNNVMSLEIWLELTRSMIQLHDMFEVGSDASSEAYGIYVGLY